MDRKKGFTLVELIAIITIISLLLIIVFPNITELSRKSRSSIRESKINSIIALGAKYGNASINKYHDCLSSATETELKNNCSISVNELVMSGYIEGDDEDYNVLDPISKKPLEGKILFCYDPVNLNINASYVEDENAYYCKAIDVETGSSLNLSSVVGKGYIGGDSVYVNIIKSGAFERNGFRCVSSDDSIASCRLDGTSRLIIDVNATDFEEPSREVKITVYGRTSKSELSQTYTLVVYPTSISLDIPEDYNKCISTNEIEQLGVTSSNAGEVEIISSDEEILKGSYNENSLAILSQNKTGLATLTVKEKNGNATSSVEKRVFHLEAIDKISEGFLLGNEQKVQLDYGGNNSVIVSTDNKDVVHFYTANQKESDTIVLDSGETEFTIKIVGTGEAKIILTGNPCGKREYPIKVSNLYLKQHNANIYVGGEAFKTEVISGSNDTYSCHSSDTNVVGCRVDGNIVSLIPASAPSNDKSVTVTVSGSSGGFDTINVISKATSFSLVDENSNPVSKVCVNKQDSINSSNVLFNGTNLGQVVLNNISNDNLTEISLSSREVVPHKKYLNNELEGLSLGHNTGISTVSLKELNGNKLASFDYYIYDMIVPENPVTVTTATSIDVAIKTFTTGPVSVTSSDTNIATVSVVNSNYSYGINQQNVSTIKINGISTGRVVITVTGSMCGQATFEVDVVGQKYHIKTLKGSYTEWIGEVNNEEISCTTTGSNNSCEITFPEMQTIDEYVIVGYSKTKDSKDKEYSVGDKLELSAANNGDVYYANSTDIVAPICVIQSLGSNTPIGEVQYLNMNCIEVGSGIEKKPTPEDFESSNPEVGKVVSVSASSPMLDDDNKPVGEIYKVGILSTSLGLYDLSLKEGAVLDRCGNKNESAKLTGIFASEFEAEAFWYIGKENEKDITAVLYDNEKMSNGFTEPIAETDEDSETDESSLKVDNRTYSLVLYGHGDMHDFMTGEEEVFAPWYLYKITNVEIRDGITNIGSYAFYNLHSLESATIPEGVTIIGEYAFFDTGLKSITIPPSVKEIQTAAFFANSELSVINLNDGLETLGDCVFQGHAAKEIYIPNTLARIPGLTFASDYDNLNLSKITFGENSILEYIGPSAFLYHIAESLTIPASVQNINHHAFAGLDAENSTLKTLTFEENSQLEYIFQEAFAENSLTKVELPDSVTVIETGAFAGSKNLTSFKVGPRVSTLGFNFIYGNNLEEFVVDPANYSFKSVDGVIYTNNGKELIKVPDKYYKSHNVLNVPSGVTSVWGYAFYSIFDPFAEEVDLTINFPSTITELNETVNFNEFAYSAFNINSDEYKSIDGILYNKDATTIYKMPTYYNKTSFTIPNTVTTVEDNFALNNITVKSVTIPDSVVKVGKQSFITDTAYALMDIHINCSSDLVYDDTSFSLLTFSNDYSTRNIFIKDPDLKENFTEKYSYMLEHLNISLES